MRNKSLGLVCISVIMFITTNLLAQTTPPNPNPPPPGMPIDGFLILLFVAAIGFGVYKIISNKKQLPKLTGSPEKIIL